MKIAYHTPTKELFRKKVQEWLDQGIVWTGGSKKVVERLWDEYREETCVRIDDSDGKIVFDDKDYYLSKNYKIMPVEKTLETLEVGDWVQKEDYYRYVLAVLHRNGEKTIYILSQACNQPDEKDPRSKYTNVDITAFELKKNNWTIYNSPSPLTEITAEEAINEIAKQRGVDPESIRIKK